MNGVSLTMGRSPENDDHNGNVVVVDISTNGTFLNYGKLPLGPTPTPLNDGDILSVGPYELLVSIGSADTSDIIADPLADDPISHGFAANAPSAAELLDAPGDGGDFLDDLLGGREAPAGPGAVNRAEPDDDGLLPPLGDDDPLLPPLEDPIAGQGASMQMHAPSAQDAFSVPHLPKRRSTKHFAALLLLRTRRRHRPAAPGQRTPPRPPRMYQLLRPCPPRCEQVAVVMPQPAHSSMRLVQMKCR